LQLPFLMFLGMITPFITLDCGRKIKK